MEENQMNALTKMLQNQLNISPTDTFSDIVRKKAERVGDKVYLTFIRDFDKGIDEKYTYRDIHVQSNRLANGFAKLGLKSGDGISVYQINSPEFLLTLFAAWKMGCYVVLVNTGLKGDGLQFIVDHSDSTTFLTHWSLLDITEDKARNCGYE